MHFAFAFALEKGFAAANGGTSTKENSPDGEDHQRQVLHNVLKQ